MKSGWMEKICPALRVLWRGSWGAGMVEPARFLHDHEMVIVTKGSCEVNMDGMRTTLKAGDYLIIPPNREHSTVCRRSVFRTCIHFDWLPSRRSFTRRMWFYAPQRPPAGGFVVTPKSIPKAVFHGSFSMDGPVPGLVETVFYRWQSGSPQGRTTARAGFLELIAHLFLHSGSRSERHATRFQLAHAVKSLLDANIRSDTGIQEMLRTLGFSDAHLSRVFHGAFGISPVEYRNTARLEHAKTLLRDSRLTIAEIAYRIGFQDAGYFSRQFRKRNRLGPRQFRSGARVGFPR